MAVQSRCLHGQARGENFYRRGQGGGVGTGERAYMQEQHSQL